MFQRDILTYLQIIEGFILSRPYNTPPQHFTEAFDRLAEFPRLNLAKIAMQCITYLYEMDSFIQKLGRKIGALSIHLDNERILQSLESINYTNIMQRPHTKHLNTRIERLRAEDLEYIMCKFSELESLRIDIKGSEEVPVLINLDITNSLNIMPRFFEFVAKLPSYSLDDMAIPQCQIVDN